MRFDCNCWELRLRILVLIDLPVNFVDCQLAIKSFSATLKSVDHSAAKRIDKSKCAAKCALFFLSKDRRTFTRTTSYPVYST